MGDQFKIFMKLIQQVHDAFPDLRICQIIENVTNSCFDNEDLQKAPRCLYNMLDSELNKHLEVYLRKLGK